MLKVQTTKIRTLNTEEKKRGHFSHINDFPFFQIQPQCPSSPRTTFCKPLTELGASDLMTITMPYPSNLRRLQPNPNQSQSRQITIKMEVVVVRENITDITLLPHRYFFFLCVPYVFSVIDKMSLPNNFPYQFERQFLTLYSKQFSVKMSIHL